MTAKTIMTVFAAAIAAICLALVLISIWAGDGRYALSAGAIGCVCLVGGIIIGAIRSEFR